jgi:hypothetical protein
MNRPLEPGDLAIIVVGDERYSLPVASVSPDRIIAGDYVLIPVADDWQIKNYNLPHAVTFQAAPREQLLSGVNDVDKLVLLNLDYKDLLAACTSDPYTNKICQDDFFWRQKVERDMGPEVMKNKLPEMSYREQYRTLINNNMNKDTAIRKGRLDYLIWKNIQPDYNISRAAARSGQINILEWTHNHGILLDQEIADYDAALNDRVNVLEWLSKKNIRPSKAAFSNAVESTSTRVVEWMLDHGITSDHPKLVANLAGYQDLRANIEMLELLEDHGMLPNTQGANEAASFGNYYILEWLHERNILPDSIGLLEAVTNNKFYVVEWLLEHGIGHPNPELVTNQAIMNNNVDMLNLLRTYGILPDRANAKVAVEQMNRGLREWLADNGIYRYSICGRDMK